MQILSTIIYGGAFADSVFGSALIKVLTSEIFILFLVIALGYLIGRINVKGISLGSSGVFIIALVVGIILEKFGSKLKINWIYTRKSDNKDVMSVITTIKDIGLGMFVAGVGFIAGPTFIRNFKKKALSYVGIGSSIIVSGTLLCILIIALDKALEAYTGVGILMGALTSTPGMSSAQGIFSNNGGDVAAACGLAYPFGVLGVVFFVQFMPKILRADMTKEIEKMKAAAAKSGQKADADGDMIAEPSKAANGSAAVSGASGAGAFPLEKKKLIKFDSLGLCIFGLAVALGMIIGAITIPLGGSLKFSLGTTGGALLVGLLFGHFGKAGRVSLEVPKTTLSAMRELGLIMFLTGSGIEGGFNFLKVFEWHYLLYGIILTMIPMLIGFVLARHAFKLELLNNLGSICGGMTSTPALGALIHVSGTEDVAQSYAATYPIALLLLVFVPQIIYFIFG